MPDRYGLSKFFSFLGIYLYAAFGPSSTAITILGFGLVGIGSVLSLDIIWKDLRRDSIFWLFLVLFFYMALSISYHTHQNPALHLEHNPHWSHWLRVGGLWSIAIGWWLFNNPGHVRWVIGALLLGLILAISYEGNILFEFEGKISDRYAYGVHPNYLGMVSAAGVLLIFGAFARSVNEGSFLLSLLTLAIASLFLLLLVGSASKGAWVGFLIGLFLFLAGYIYQGLMNRRVALAIAGGIGLLFVGLIWYGGEHIENRVLQDVGAISEFAEGDIVGAYGEKGSFGTRVGLWEAGRLAFLDRPLLGWGPSPTPEILERTYDQKDQFSHLHNLYLEFLVSFGSFGFFVFLAAHWLMIKRAFLSDRRSLKQKGDSAVLAAVLASTAVSLFFAIRIGQVEGRAFLTLILALVFAHIWQHKNFPMSSR